MGLDTIAYNVISNRRAAQARNPAPSPEVRPARWLASDSSSARSRCITRSIWTCWRRWMRASGGPAIGSRRNVTSRQRYGCSLITVRRALSELSASNDSSGRAGAGRSCSIRASIATSPASSPSPRRCRLRGLDPATRLVAARPESAGRGRGRRPRARARLADALPRAAAPRRRRAAPARAGPPARRAVPGAAGLRPRARLALRPADRTLRRPHRQGARSPRAGPAARPRGAPARPPAGDAGPPHRRHRSHRGGSSGRIRPDLRAWRSDPLLRGAGGGPAAVDWIGRGPGDEEEDRHASIGRPVTR